MPRPLSPPLGPRSALKQIVRRMTPDNGPELPSPSDLLATFDSSHDLMCLRDLAGRLVRVNRAWELTLGYPLDEMANTPMLPLVHPADVGATRLRMAEADGRRDIVDFVNRYRRRDGTYRHMQWRAQRFGDVIVGRARDVTAIHERAAELHASGEVLQDTLAALARHVGSTSDEIARAVRALGRTRLTSGQAATLRALEHSAHTLDDLASRLAHVERREADWAVVSRALEPRPHAFRRIEARTERRSAAVALRDVTPRAPMVPAGPPGSVAAWVSEMETYLDGNRVFLSTFRDLPSLALGLASIRLGRMKALYPRRIQSLSVESGLMSAGRAAALLARMQDIGFVDAPAEFLAGQIRPYRVRPAMTEAFAGLMRVNLRSLAAVDPAAAATLEALQADPELAPRLLASLGEAYADAFRGGDPVLGGLLNGALMMAKGHAIALSIGADAVLRNGAGREGWIEVSLTTYARRFEVSRAHVRRVLKRLEACGVEPDPSTRSRLRVSEQFHDELERYRETEHRRLRQVVERTA